MCIKATQIIYRVKSVYKCVYNGFTVCFSITGYIWAGNEHKLRKSVCRSLAFSVHWFSFRKSNSLSIHWFNFRKWNSLLVHWFNFRKWGASFCEYVPPVAPPIYVFPWQIFRLCRRQNMKLPLFDGFNNITFFVSTQKETHTKFIIPWMILWVCVVNIFEGSNANITCVLYFYSVFNVPFSTIFDGVGFGFHDVVSRKLAILKCTRLTRSSW